MNSTTTFRVAQSLLRTSRPRLLACKAPTQSRFFQSSRQYYQNTSSKQRPPSSGPSRISLIAGAGVISLAIGIAIVPRASFDSPAIFASFHDHNHDDEETRHLPDTRPAHLPRFRLSEVRKHGSESDQPWVIHGDKVYDITDWVPAHPGGKIILTAAGGSIDKYWDIFSIHKTQYVYDILAQYLIGYVHPDDLKDGLPPLDQIEDPFADDPERHPSLITRTAKPRNAETPGDAMSAQFLTPNELFYVRNHMWVPRIADTEADDHRLTIEMHDGTTKEYTLHDLKTKFPKRQITAVLQCSGNRRKHMTDGSGRSTNGLQWSAGAISNASWEGVYLADVLADAGFENTDAFMGSSPVKHVHFAGMEAYAASIPIKKAVDPQGDVLLAYGMNGKPLPRDHGFPLRTIVPGNVAARSVKWLSHVTLSEEESTSQWQRKDYKCFGPNEIKVDWDKAPSIQELPVQSAVTSARLGTWKTIQSDNSATEPSQSRAQDISLTGYAFSGGGRSIIRVDVSLDNGKTWSQAQLLPDSESNSNSEKPLQTPSIGNGSWAWKRWKVDGAVPLEAFSKPCTPKDQDEPYVIKRQLDDEPSNSRCCTTVVVKATDEVYNTQPDSHAATWNVRGNLANAWHRVQVCTDCSKAKESTK